MALWGRLRPGLDAFLRHLSEHPDTWRLMLVPTGGGTAVRCRAETEDAIVALGMLDVAKATIIANVGRAE